MEICNSIRIGECGVDLAMRNPCCLNHSRWLTTANRILLLYVSDKKPSENLKTLVTYIIRIYAQMWFATKAHSSCKDGARHLHQMLVKSRYLSPKHKKIVDPVIHRNAYFAHRRICSDYRPHIRELGRSAHHSGQIRRFKVRDR